MKLDPINERIIAILSDNARTSNREVAQAIGISETAVRKRLKRLEQEKLAKVTALVSDVAGGKTVAAFVRMRTTPASAHAVADALTRHEAATYVALTAGRFNITALVTTEDRAKLVQLLHSELRSLPGVQSIDVTELVRIAKMRLDIVLIPPHGPDVSLSALSPMKQGDGDDDRPLV